MSTESSPGRSPRQAQSGPEPEPPADTPKPLGSQVPSKEEMAADPSRGTKPCPAAELSLGAGRRPISESRAGRGSHFQQHDEMPEMDLKVKPASGAVRRSVHGPQQADPRCSMLLCPPSSPSCALTLSSAFVSGKKNAQVSWAHSAVAALSASHLSLSSERRLPWDGHPGEATGLPARGQGLGSEHGPA